MAEVIVTPGGQQYWMSGAHEAVGAPKAGLIERYVEANRGTIVPYNERMQWMMLRISGSVVRLRAGSAGNN